MSREIRVSLTDLPDGSAVRLEGGPFGVCLARTGNDVYALADRCSHQLWLLSDGEVDPYECTIECTKHGSTFSLKDGHPQCLPATQPVDVYPTRVEGDEIVVTVP
ncbi:MAG TPA: non-heme iron oxygenase ferredoxin subunit [Acidimicrobiales bacterium]|nr:non-heme iron oxygenase ferredoxin subunit [Acidimicrobiales bacterium]